MTVKTDEQIFHFFFLSLVQVLVIYLPHAVLMKFLLSNSDTYGVASNVSCCWCGATDRTNYQSELLKAEYQERSSSFLLNTDALWSVSEQFTIKEGRVRKGDSPILLSGFRLARHQVKKRP